MENKENVCKTRFVLLLILLMLICLISLTGCSCKYHDLETEIVRDATCTVDGIKRKYCSKCDYSVEETFSGSHDFKEEKILKIATCSKSGESIFKCSVCGKTENRATFVSHSYSGFVCTVCGDEKPLPELSIGMSKNQVQRKWGEPIDIDKSTSFSGTLETWWYKYKGKTISVRFDEYGKVWSIVES